MAPAGPRTAAPPTAPREAPAPALPPAHLGLLGLGGAGAGLVAVALGADHLRHGGVAVAVALVALGAVVGGHGLLRLRTHRPASRREAVAPAIAGAAWAALAASGAVPAADGVAVGRPAADAALVALLLLLAVTAAAGARTPVALPADAAPRHVARHPVARLAGWAGGAVLVAAITATGLAATEAGRHAVDHGGHTTPAGGAGPDVLRSSSHAGH